MEGSDKGIPTPQPLDSIYICRREGLIPHATSCIPGCNILYSPPLLSFVPLRPVVQPVAPPASSCVPFWPTQVC
jgi:hypothetical protein